MNVRKIDLLANAEKQKFLVVDDSVNSCKLMADTKNASDLDCTNA